MARMPRSSSLIGALIVGAALALAGCATNAGPGAAPDRDRHAAPHGVSGAS